MLPPVVVGAGGALVMVAVTIVRVLSHDPLLMATKKSVLTESEGVT
jgi:hypothetical protein